MAGVAPKRRWFTPLVGVALAALGASFIGLGGMSVVTAQSTSGNNGVDAPRMLDSLNKVKVTTPSNLSDFVADKNVAIALGKAFFWDQQMGSDGQTACASCHYQAGADIRTKNTISPGLMAGSLNWYGKGPNAQLTADDYPFHHLFNPDDAYSPVISDSNTVTGAQGVFDSTFKSPGAPGVLTKGVDICDQANDGVFSITGISTRRVTGRNAPSVINAAYNFRNFWDGRANNNFNGVNPFGDRDPNAVIYKAVSGALQPTRISIPFSSLASQSVGPPGSGFEMSCGGRIFPNMGRKMLTAIPLGQQLVDPTDSVLGMYASSKTRAAANGLTTTYVSLIQKAFKPEYWNSSGVVTIGDSSPVSASMLMSDLVKIIAPNKVISVTARDQKRDQIQISTNQYTQMEANFSLFWGLAIQLYEDTLISDQSPVDRFFDGDSTALSPEQRDGLAIFETTGRCVNCHGGPETTNASVSKVTGARLERMHTGDGDVGVYDDGFYNIGVRPTTEDHGLAGTDPFGNPLSEARLCQRQLASGKCDPQVLNIVGRSGELLPASPLTGDERIAVDGTFKTPTLRNVELTGPYFHNGGQATLRQVVDFYNRGGDFADANLANLDTDVSPIGLGPQERNDLVDFLLGLTDDRVKWEKAPFDHPSLCVPDGHPGSTTAVTADPKHMGPPPRATDTLTCLPAIGAKGRSAAQGALKPFLNLDPHTPASDTGPIQAGADPTAPSVEIAGEVRGTAPNPFGPPPVAGSAAPASVMSFGQTAPAGMVTIDGHLWVADHVQGLCRLDHVPDGTSSAQWAVNADTCDPQGRIGSPGQPTYDPRGNFIYVPDNSHKSPGVWRLKYDPGTQTVSTPLLMAPAQGLAGLGITATALGSDGKLYIGGLKDPWIRRITNPDGDPRLQKVELVAQTTDGRGINGSIAFSGNDLYLPENRGLSVVENATGRDACMVGGTCPASMVPLDGVASVNSVASNGNGAVYVASLPLAPGAARGGRGGGPAPISILRLNAGSTVAEVFETQGQIPSGNLNEYCFTGPDPEDCTRMPDPWTAPGAQVGLYFVQGMYVDPSGALYIGDDPLAGQRFGTGHVWVVR